MRQVDLVRIYRYRLPLRLPIFWGDKFHSHREGLLVCLRFGEREGWGDIAPLPGFSQESLLEAEAQAVSLAKQIEKSSLDSLDFGVHPRYSSVQFGFEFAQHNLTVEKTGNLDGYRPPIICCKLLDQPNYTMSDLHGYRAIKIKVGRQSLEDDIELVHTVCQMDTGIEVRIDANRAWTLQEAKEFLLATQNLSLGYIEEPLQDKSQLIEFARSCQIPIALDETLREVGAKRYRQYASVYVLKPTLSGGISGVLKEIYQARDRHIRCIISSSYESGVGILGLMELARKIPDEVHGLNTYQALEQDVISVPLGLNGPNLQGNRYLIQKDRLNLSVLQHIYTSGTAV